MTGEVETETPAVITETEKTDKELIAEEEKAAEADKGDEKTDDAKEESKEEKPAKKETKKPTVFKKDWEEGKVYLYQTNRTPRIPSIVPKELKVESFLKLHGIPYENVNHNSRISLKKVRMPYIELNGEEVADVDLLLHIAEKYEKNPTGHLTPEQVNIEHAMIKMVENHLYWAIISWRTEFMENTIKSYKINLSHYLDSKLPPALLNLHYKMNVAKKMQKKTKSQGFSDLNKLAEQDMKVLSEMLGDKMFIFGEEPSMLDLAVFSVLAQLVMVDEEVTCPLRDHMKENYNNLMELVTRVKDKCWAEHWDMAIGDNLDLNPHIPKPEPAEEKPEEKEEEKAEEKKEETEDKKEEEKEEI